GLLRQWRRLLSLFLCGGAGLRPHRTGGHLCPRLSAHRRSLGLWHSSSAAENPPHRNDRALMSDLAALSQKLAAAFPGAKAKLAIGELTLTVDGKDVLPLLTHLHADPECD